MLELIKLRKKYGQKVVLNDINLSFEFGKIYGIVGENGAGKTTLFKCIAGLISYEGTISSAFPNLKNHLGYLETNPYMMSYITAWEYLKLLCTAKKIESENFEEQNIFNLPLNQYAETYSSGMKKKLALMGVLLQKNDIIILDEPFNGVDIQSNMLIAEILKELKSLNKIILISSHIFSTLKESCDEIILLSKTKVSNQVKKNEYEALEQSMKEQIIRDKLKKIKIE